MARPTPELVAEYRNNPYVRAFLDTIAAAEGTATIGTMDGYDVLFGGKAFADFDAHPNVSTQFANNKTTTSAGRYQINKPTYDDFAAKLGITDFSPQSQDDIAIAIMIQANALDDIVNNNLQGAMNKLGTRWAALPTSKYDQPSRTNDFVYSAYNDALANYLGGASQQALQFDPTQIPSIQAAARITEQSTTPSVRDRIASPGNVSLTVAGGPLTPETFQQLTQPFNTTGRQPLSNNAPAPNLTPSPQQTQPIVPQQPMVINTGNPDGTTNAPMLIDTSQYEALLAPSMDAMVVESTPAVQNQELINLAQETGLGTVERLLWLRRELSQAAQQTEAQNAFSRYPSFFDNEFLALIDSAPLTTGG